MSNPRVFTIPASVPFLRTLIEALVAGELVPDFNASDPLAFASATIYLPTHRAVRIARDVFLDVLGKDAAILPRMAAIGDLDDDEIAFAEMATGTLAEDALSLAEALGGFERKMLLAQLILKWAASPQVRGPAGSPLVAGNPATALALADDLARLIDDMTTRNVSWDKLDDLVPDSMDRYWGLTLRFLKIAREQWPAILKDRKAIEPAARRDELIKAETARLAKHNGPVIAAGSTGSMPSTAMLLAAIARMPHGAVVLPGLDTNLDDTSWDMIAGKETAGAREIAPSFGHPQFAMQALLRMIGIKRDGVVELRKPAPHGREALVSEALRPAATSDKWEGKRDSKDFTAHLDTAFAGLSVVAAANAEDEALAIAVILREAAEEDGKTAALVTPDRALARRVLAALQRWKVPVDDSGGGALADTSAGIFARLAAEVALGGAEPVPLLALLKHPLFRLGAPGGGHARSIGILERAVLRGPRPAAGMKGLAGALAALRRARDDKSLHRSDPRMQLTDSEIASAETLAANLTQALAPLETLAVKDTPFLALAALHRKVIEALSTDGTDIAAFTGPDGVALEKAFADVADSPPDVSLSIALSDYVEVFNQTIGANVVRRPGDPGARVRIYGPLEARLQQPDRVVLGGLVEGVWPPDPRGDPWLSRPMRRDLGLDLPERRIGLSAHDFAQMLGAKEVFLTHAAKLAGAPTVPSRFLQRLAALSGKDRWNEAIKRGEQYLIWAHSLDRPAHEPRPVSRPEPRPPLAARPKKLSVTEIEHWLRDPYTIYAKHILRLARLDAVDTAPGGAERGSFIHDAIGDFTKLFAEKLPADPFGELIAIGRARFAPISEYPEARALWWPRFESIARWFAHWESERRATLAATQAEIYGQLQVSPDFLLTGRADRIDRLTDGRYTILDYKTGAIPSDKQVRIGISPQLTLEAAILRHGGFEPVTGAVSIAELVYVKLKGRDIDDRPEAVDFKDRSADDAAEYALTKLKELIARFSDEAQPYRSIVLSMWKNRYGAYDDLARVKEWSNAGANGDGGDGA